ncbi:MAG: hypothetical protein AB7O68_16580 [Pirellulales bacterium]
MDEKPKRRWFRFRLSTIMILTAIVAWGMATRPYFLTRDELIVAPNAPHEVPSHFNAKLLRSWKNAGTEFYLLRYCDLNPSLGWPASVLTAFLAWKAGWAVVERRRARRATHC